MNKIIRVIGFILLVWCAIESYRSSMVYFKGKVVDGIVVEKRIKESDNIKGLGKSYAISIEYINHLEQKAYFLNYTDSFKYEKGDKVRLALYENHIEIRSITSIFLRPFFILSLALMFFLAKKNEK